MLDERLTVLYKKIDELEMQEKWLELVKVYQECIQISLEVYGEYHDETLALYSEYGGLLRNLGRYEESLNILNKALKCAEKTKGSMHPDYAAALVNLANLLRMMKYYKESEALFLKAKEIYERTNGTALFPYAGLCNNLGLLYQGMDRFEEAIPLHKISLGILEKDPHHEILCGVTLNNLVEPYKHLGNRAKAIEYLKKALEIFKKNIDHASVLYAAAMNNLGAIYYEDKDYLKARECFKTAIQISKEKLGTESESYKNSVINYERTLEKIKEQSSIPDSASLALDTTETKRPERKKMTIDKNSKGLEIAEAYFFDVCYPMLEKEFAAYLPRMAAGLVGEGSECYGFDDMISRDHDFGPSFQIFIPQEDMEIYGKKLIQKVNALPKSYCCFDERNQSCYGENRVGVWTIEDFYDKYLSIHTVPTSNHIWIQMEDIPLSTATNGKVFMDNLGQFSKIREGLLKHYPRDVRLKRMAALCMQMAQSGQYNFPRSLQRGQFVAAYHALDEFARSCTSFVYLINKTYKPYYKWEQEGLKRLPIMGQLVSREIDKLVLVPVKEKPKYATFIIENLCKRIIAYLQKEQLTSSKSDFLLEHGPQILTHIQDEKLRISNPWLEK